MNVQFKIFSTILFCSILNCACFTQVQFYLSNNILDESVDDGILYKNKYYFLYNEGLFDANTNPLLYEMDGYTNYLLKMDEGLQIIDSVKFDSIDGYLIKGKQIEINEDTIYVFGLALRYDNPLNDGKIFMARLLTDLEIIDTRLIGISNKSLQFKSFIINHRREILISANSNYEENSWGDFTYLLLSTNNEIIKTEIDTSFNTISPIALQLPDSKIYVFNDRYHTRIYDSSFNLVKHYYPIYSPQFFQFQFENDNYINDTYFIGGFTAEVEPNENPEEIAYYRVDTAHNRIDSGIINFPGTIDYCRGLDFHVPYTLCFGGNHDFEFLGYPAEFQPNLQSLVVKSINTTTNIENWSFNYGGDASYSMKGLFVTSQNECIVYATRYDWMNTDVLERDLLILKIDSSGVLVSENKINTINDINVFPNPGNDYLTISLPEPFKYTVFEIYDIYGKLMLSTQLSGRRNILHTSHLRSGTYVYKIYNQEGLRESGKWIKKY